MRTGIDLRTRGPVWTRGLQDWYGVEDWYGLEDWYGIEDLRTGMEEEDEDSTIVAAAFKVNPDAGAIKSRRMRLISDPASLLP